MFSAWGRGTLTLFTWALAMTTLLSSSQAQLATIVRCIPREIEGWAARDDGRNYDRDSLFEYIDGGAELYLAYGFREAYVCRYEKAGGSPIHLDIYDMGKAEDAFGVFSVERGGAEAGLGQGSDYASGLLRFHKGPFFVSITAFEETRASKAAVSKLGKAVADAIPKMGQVPAILSELPRDGLVEGSIRYLHLHTILNNLYYVAEENILHLDRTTDAALAEYRQGHASSQLLLVRYPSTAQATDAYRSFTKAYMPDATKRGIIRTEDDRWTAVERYRDHLVIVFDALSDEFARGQLRAARSRLRRNR